MLKEATGQSAKIDFTEKGYQLATEEIKNFSDAALKRLKLIVDAETFARLPLDRPGVEL